MTKQNTFLYNQRGGMLMELMLAIAIAAILIPFVFRYQRNTVERARNVAIVRQMGLVQRALEKCIEDNQSDFTKHVGDSHIFSSNDTNLESGRECFVLKDNNDHGLIRYGLTDAFADDYGEDYVIRVLKNKDVLQGVVLLQNAGITALRTREIVDIGGGTLGSIQNDIVRGGYNSFNVKKNKFGLADNITNGIVKTTATIRGQVADPYVWRVIGGSATMLSDFDMGGNNITNVKKLQGATLKTQELKYNPLRGDSGIYADKFFIKEAKPTNALNLSNTNWSLPSSPNGYSKIATVKIGKDKELSSSSASVETNPELIIADKRTYNLTAPIYTDELRAKNLNVRSDLKIDAMHSYGTSGSFLKASKGVDVASITANNIVVPENSKLYTPKVSVACFTNTDDGETYWWNKTGNLIRQSGKSACPCNGEKGALVKNAILEKYGDDDDNGNGLVYTMRRLMHYESDNEGRNIGMPRHLYNYIKNNEPIVRQQMRGFINDTNSQHTVAEFLEILSSIQKALKQAYGFRLDVTVPPCNDDSN